MATVDEKRSIEQEERADNALAQAMVNNVNARIQNPLHGIPQATLLSQVDEFVEEKGFQEYSEVFRKAAILAQQPAAFESLPLLDEEDRAVIRREKTRE